MKSKKAQIVVLVAMAVLVALAVFAVGHVNPKSFQNNLTYGAF